MTSIQRITNVKDALAERGIRGIRPTELAEDIVLRDETRRARLSYAEALQVIAEAADAASLWARLEAMGRMWPHPPADEPQVGGAT